jgi:hypothetical protein
MGVFTAAPPTSFSCEESPQSDLLDPGVVKAVETLEGGVRLLSSVVGVRLNREGVTEPEDGEGEVVKEKGWRGGAAGRLAWEMLGALWRFLSVSSAWVDRKNRQERRDSPHN